MHKFLFSLLMVGVAIVTAIVTIENYDRYDLPYEVIEKTQYDVACITSAHNNIAPPYLSAESSEAYLVNINWKETYYLKDALCSITWEQKGGSDNININSFWKVWGTWVESVNFKCDYVADSIWECSVLYPRPDLWPRPEKHLWK